MNLDDLSKLENALGLALPQAYREFLQNPPFEEDSSAYESFCFGNVDHLIAENCRFREHYRAGNPKAFSRSFYAKFSAPHEFIFIGTDLGSGSYVMDLREPALPVYYVDHSNSLEVDETYACFGDLISEELESESEAKQEDLRRTANPGNGWSFMLRFIIFILVLGIGAMLYMAIREALR
jgi:hypothetical protein